MAKPLPLIWHIICPSRLSSTDSSSRKKLHAPITMSEAATEKEEEIVVSNNHPPAPVITPFPNHPQPLLAFNTMEKRWVVKKNNNNNTSSLEYAAAGDQPEYHWTLRRVLKRPFLADTTTNDDGTRPTDEHHHHQLLSEARQPITKKDLCETITLPPSFVLSPGENQESSIHAAEESTSHPCPDIATKKDDASTNEIATEKDEACSTNEIPPPPPNTIEPYSSREHSLDSNKIVVQYGAHARKNKDYFLFRSQWNDKYQNSDKQQQQKIIEDALHRFSFVREDNGQVLDDETAMIKVFKDFEKQRAIPTNPIMNCSQVKAVRTSLSAPTQEVAAITPMMNDHAFLPQLDGQADISTTIKTLQKKDGKPPSRPTKNTKNPISKRKGGKKSIVLLGRANFNKNQEYVRLRMQWKSKYDAGCSEERARLLDQILQRFVFVQNGKELKPALARTKVRDHFRAHLKQPKPNPQCNRLHTTAKSGPLVAKLQAKSSNASKAGLQSSKAIASQISNDDCDDTSAQPMESEKLIVYGGANCGKEGNLAYLSLLKEKKWDYVNAKTEEEASKVVDSFLDTFIFRGFTLEAARKKVSKALADVGKRVPKRKFQWKRTDESCKNIAIDQNLVPESMGTQVEHRGMDGKPTGDAVAPQVTRAGGSNSTGDSSMASNACSIGKKRKLVDGRFIERDENELANYNYLLPKASKIVSPNENDWDCDLVIHRDKNKQVSTTTIIQEAVSEVVGPVLAQLAQLQQQSQAFLQSQQYLDAAKMFRELGEPEKAKELMDKYRNSLTEPDNANI